MDNFHETLVTKRPSGSDTAKRIGIVIVGMFLAAVVFFFAFVLFPLNLVIAGGIMYGAYYLVSGLDTEYEYTVTNNEIDFDKISGRRSRKRLITADIKLFENFGKISDAPETPSDCTVVQVSDNTGENEYFADFKHASLGNVRIIFTPDEDMIGAIEPYLSGPLKNELKRRKLLEK